MFNNCRQIAAADVILLNKIDLVSESILRDTDTLLHRINPSVTVHHTIRGEIDLKYVINVGAYASGALLQTKYRSKMVARTFHEHDYTDHSSHDGDHGGHTHATHYEMQGISSLQVNCPILSSAQFDKLDEWIRNVLWENELPGSQNMDSSPRLEVLRCKGIFTVESGEIFVLQGVRNMYEIAPVKTGADIGVPELGKLVFIGKGLNDSVRVHLQKIFQ